MDRVKQNNKTKRNEKNMTTQILILILKNIVTFTIYYCIQCTPLPSFLFFVGLIVGFVAVVIFFLHVFYVICLIQLGKQYTYHTKKQTRIRRKKWGKNGRKIQCTSEHVRGDVLGQMYERKNEKQWSFLQWQNSKFLVSKRKIGIRNEIILIKSSVPSRQMHDKPNTRK